VWKNHLLLSAIFLSKIRSHHNRRKPPSTVKIASWLSAWTHTVLQAPAVFRLPILGAGALSAGGSHRNPQERPLKRLFENPAKTLHTSYFPISEAKRVKIPQKTGDFSCHSE
jgi:hypothetical protein